MEYADTLDTPHRAAYDVGRREGEAVGFWKGYAEALNDIRRSMNLEAVVEMLKQEGDTDAEKQG